MHGQSARRTIVSFVSAGLFALSTTSGIARAESPLTVFAISTKEAPEQARLLTDTMKAELSRIPSLAFAESSESLTLLAIALKCSKPLNETCSARIANHLRAPRILWGTIDGGVAEIRYFVDGREISDQIPVAPSLSREQASVGVRRFFRRAITKAAEIRLTQVSTRASVELDGRAIGSTNPGEPFAIDVPAGTHSITVKRAGAAPFSRTVKLEPLQEWSVPLVWQAVAVDVPPRKEEPSAPVVSSAAGNDGRSVAPKAKSSITRSAGAWTLIGLGTAGIGFGVFGQIRYLQIENEIGEMPVRLKSPPPTLGFDPCHGASEPLLVDPVGTADLCRRKETGDQWSRIGWIATGVGAAALATGIVLLLTAPSESSSDRAERRNLRAKIGTPRVTDVAPFSNGTGVSLSGIF